jgi:hypothetical protein
LKLLQLALQQTELRLFGLKEFIQPDGL